MGEGPSLLWVQCCFFQQLKPFYQHLLKFVCTLGMTCKSLLNPLLGLGYLKLCPLPSLSTLQPARGQIQELPLLRAHSNVLETILAVSLFKWNYSCAGDSSEDYSKLSM